MIAEITINRLGESDKTLRVAILDKSGRVANVRTISGKIGYRDNTIIVDLNDGESIRVSSLLD